MKSPAIRWLMAAFALLAACATSDPCDRARTRCATRNSGPALRMDFARAGSLYDAPFPSDDLRLPDGRLNLSKLPNPTGNAIMGRAFKLLGRDARGFGQASGIYFRSERAVDPASLPALHSSTQADASVFVAAVDGPTAGQRVPVHVGFMADGGPYGAPNLLAILPLQGLPLRPQTRYVAVVTGKIRYLAQAAGEDSGPRQAPAVDALRHLHAPAGLNSAAAESYAQGLVAATRLVGADEIAAMAVFTTDNRPQDLPAAVAQMPASALAVTQPPKLTENFADFCVYQGELSVPVLQSGKPPYAVADGDWRLDAAGKLAIDHSETARLWITVPKKPVGGGKLKTVIFVGTGGGGERPLVDRGACATEEFTQAIAPGTGPAREFARVGWAGVQIDGTLEGPRNPTGANEDFLLFNVANPAAMRDNLRQSALEIALLPVALASLSFDASGCLGAGAPPVQLDMAAPALMGHSMGASIAPLAAAAQPKFRAVLLSGAGGSFIRNIVDKQKPVPVAPFAEALLDYTPIDRHVSVLDPGVSLFQWAVEPADAQVYGQLLAAGNGTQRHFLVMQGIVDHYILPSIANATNLAVGADLVGPALDAQNAELRSLQQPSLAEMLPLAGRKLVAFGAAGNALGATRLVVQNLSDAIEDGHEHMFQTPRPKAQYRCFLGDLAAGRAPTVRDSSAENCWNWPP